MKNIMSRCFQEVHGEFLWGNVCRKITGNNWEKYVKVYRENEWVVNGRDFLLRLTRLPYVPKSYVTTHDCYYAALHYLLTE